MLFYISYYNKTLVPNQVVTALYPGNFKDRSAAVLFAVPGGLDDVIVNTATLYATTAPVSTPQATLMAVDTFIPTTWYTQSANIDVGAITTTPNVWERN